VFSLIIISSVFGCDQAEQLFGGDKEDSGPTDPGSISSDVPDAAGNLVIRNLTGERLVLYKGGEITW
jgi:hypothetical protein